MKKLGFDNLTKINFDLKDNYKNKLDETVLDDKLKKIILAFNFRNTYSKKLDEDFGYYNLIHLLVSLINSVCEYLFNSCECKIYLDNNKNKRVQLYNINNDIYNKYYNYITEKNKLIINLTKGIVNNLDLFVD